MEPKQIKKIFSRIGISLFVLLLVVNAVQILMTSAALAYKPELIETTWFSMLLIFLSFHVIGFLVFILMTKKIPSGERGPVRKLSPIHILITYLVCMATTYLLNYVSLFINYLIGLIKKSAVLNPLESVVSTENILLTALVVAIIAPIVEEIIFRGIILDKLRPFGDKTAIWVTALAFGLYHGNLSQFFYATALGAIFAYLAIRTNTIRYSILLHILINMTGSVVMPLLVSVQNPLMPVIAVILIFTFIISGIILYFVFRKKTYLEDALVPIPKHIRFRTIYLNTGMILYFIGCLLMFLFVLLV